MKRRNFIVKTGVASSILGLGSTAFLNTALSDQTKGSKKISILHTNDVHSHIEAFESTHSKYPNRGGVARRYAYINMVKKENPNTLILDAGDSFQGTPYFNFYGGELEFKLMSKMGYHASTIGNHEFDNGIDNIAAQLAHAEFSMLNANYNFKNTILDGMVKPYDVYELGGVKIGVFGIGIELDGLVTKKLYKETEYFDPVDITKDIVKKLKKEEACDLVICLSHLGYNYSGRKICDIKLAQQTRDIDLIIGGHTHTFLEKPTRVENLDFKTVLVNQVGWAGLNMGRIDFYMDEAKASQEAVIEL
jgi:5'-nucleotidase